MTCPVNVSLSGGYPDGRTRRRGQEPAEPPQVRGTSVGFSGSTTGTPFGRPRTGPGYAPPRMPPHGPRSSPRRRPPRRGCGARSKRRFPHRRRPRRERLRLSLRSGPSGLGSWPGPHAAPPGRRRAGRAGTRLPARGRRDRPAQPRDRDVISRAPRLLTSRRPGVMTSDQFASALRGVPVVRVRPEYARKPAIGRLNRWSAVCGLRGGSRAQAISPAADVNALAQLPHRHRTLEPRMSPSARPAPRSHHLASNPGKTPTPGRTLTSPAAPTPAYCRFRAYFGPRDVAFRQTTQRQWTPWPTN